MTTLYYLSVAVIFAMGAGLQYYTQDSTNPTGLGWAFVFFFFMPTTFSHTLSRVGEGRALSKTTKSQHHCDNNTIWSTDESPSQDSTNVDTQSSDPSEKPITNKDEALAVLIALASAANSTPKKNE